MWKAKGQRECLQKFGENINVTKASWKPTPGWVDNVKMGIKETSWKF
jgi:hypothetical protein